MAEPPVREHFLPFARPVIEQSAIDSVVDSLRSGWLVRGEKVARFEACFADYVGVKRAVALTSGVSALHLSLLVAGVGPGDDVITSPLTFAATANAIMHTGARPVFADIDRSTQNLDPERVAEAVTDRTRALLAVHMGGRPCGMDAIHEIARANGLVVLEDAAHAVGAEYHGHKVGALSDLTAFSLHATKNLTTGEGGMVTTDNTEWADTILTYSQHGLSVDAWERARDQTLAHPLAVLPGFKCAMTDLGAAIGLEQLRRAGEWRSRREAIAQRYDLAFGECPVHPPTPPEPKTVHARHLYTVLLDVERIGIERDRVRAQLHGEGIGTSVHYIPLHLHPFYSDLLQHGPGDFPHAEWVGERTLSLPLTPFLSDDDVSDVITAVRKVLGRPRTSD